MSLNSERNNTHNFESDNFITEEQALILAKQYLVPKGDQLYNLKKMRFINGNDSQYNAIPKTLFETDWVIIVPTKLKVQMLQGLKWGIVYVNKKTGEVTPGGMGPS